VEYDLGVTNVNFQDPQFEDHQNNESHSNHQSLKRFLEALSICHTIISDKKKSADGQTYIDYNASSPDELALVNGARHLGFGFRDRDADENMVVDTWDGLKKYKLLNLIEFDSTRKRMTVIVKT
jgi:magnesium-transporting ATPase (P-type)